MLAKDIPQNSTDIMVLLRKHGFDGNLVEFIGSLFIFKATDYPLTFVGQIIGLSFEGPDYDEDDDDANPEFYANIMPIIVRVPRVKKPIGGAPNDGWEHEFKLLSFHREGKEVKGTVDCEAMKGRIISLRGTVEFIKR